MVVFFHGGTWRSGARGDYAFVGHALAAQSVMTLIADYRLYPEVQFPEFLRDSASAAVWGMRAASQLGADPTRVLLMGHSAGAYNAAMLALDPQWLREAGASTSQALPYQHSLPRAQRIRLLLRQETPCNWHVRCRATKQ